MKRITAGLMSLQKSGEIIGFDSREEYDDWLKTPDSKNASRLYAEPKYVLEGLKGGDEAEEQLNRLIDWVNDKGYGYFDNKPDEIHRILNRE